MILEIMQRYPRTYQHVRSRFCDLGGTPASADFFMEGLCILRPGHFLRGVEDDLTDKVANDKLNELNDLIADCVADRSIHL